VDDHLAVLRLILAVPFAVAGTSRLRDRPGLRVLGVVEIGAAVLLMYGAVAWWAAVLACAVLVVLGVTGAIAAAHDSGSPVGLPVMLRSLALAIPAALVVSDGPGPAGPDVVSWLSSLTVVQQLTIAAGIVALAFAAYGRRPAPPPANKPTAAALIGAGPQLTIGMATYDDFDGVYFTLQALRLYHDLDRTELLVVDNYGCQYTKDLVSNWANGTYVLANDIVGTAAARDMVFRRATGDAVLCCDSHVLFAPGVISRLKRFYHEAPDCADLLQGPMVYDDGRLIATHFDPVWRDQMWGTWATDERAYDPDGEPFDIPMQGLGAFACRTDAWPGFHPGFRGFGGEEGYIHEKFRQAGHRCLCVPWLRWMHRFGRPKGTPYPLTVDDKFRNYLLGHTELGLDTAPVLDHFSQYLAPGRVAQIAGEAAAWRAGR
jgi:hypothetical protein